jgi:hypothetical protein
VARAAATFVCSMNGCRKPAARFLDEIPVCAEHYRFWTKPGAFSAAKVPARRSTAKR